MSILDVVIIFGVVVYVIILKFCCIDIYEIDIILVEIKFLFKQKKNK